MLLILQFCCYNADINFSYLYIGAAGFSQRFDLVSKVGTGLYIAAFLGMQWRAWARVCYQDLKRGRCSTFTESASKFCDIAGFSTAG